MKDSEPPIQFSLGTALLLMFVAAGILAGNVFLWESIMLIGFNVFAATLAMLGLTITLQERKARFASKALVLSILLFVTSLVTILVTIVGALTSGRD